MSPVITLTFFFQISKEPTDDLAAKRASICTISAMIPPPLPPVKKTLPNWHDKQMDVVDKTFLVVFPLLFIIFNGVYWPFLVNYREILEQ